MTKGHMNPDMALTTPASGERPAALAGADVTVVSIPVADQDRALRFYRDTLGFSVLHDTAFDGLRWLQLAVPGGRCSIALVTWFDSMAPGAVQGLVLQTPDVRRDHAALARRGVAFTGWPAEDFYGTHAEFSDPDGNGWILLQAPAGS